MGAQLNTVNPLANISNQTLVSAIESSRSPLIVTDYLRSDNPIIYSNRSFLELTGYEMEDVIGQNCRFLQGTDTDKKAINALRQAVKKQTYVRVNLKNYKKDGTPFWNDLVMSPIKNEAGKTTHFLGMQLDITDRVTAEEALQSKTNALERSNHELEQFTYATSHDLQEPLRMISSYLQLISRRYDNKLDEDFKTFLGFATEGAERMQDLIYDLLSLSRVTTSSDRFQPTEIKTVIDRALFDLTAAIKESKAQITVNDMPTLRVDPVQVTQLFQNLVSNAIKYGPKDDIPKITITATHSGNNYEFSVTDNGIGIAEQYYDRIFTVFQRLHTRSEYPGSGIGLALCSKIIDRHGGKIWVESAVGQGSTFKFTIPDKTINAE